VQVNKLKKFLKRARLAKAILFADREMQSVFVSSEDQVKASIRLTILKNGIKCDTIEDEVMVKKLVDNIYYDIHTKGFNPLHSLTQLSTAIFHNQSWNLAIVAGIATLWELKLRIMSTRLGVSNLIDHDKKTKKQKNMEQIGYKKLEDVISELQKKYDSRFSLDLTWLNSLRGAIVHTNLQQLRILYHNNHKKFYEEIKGNVMSFSISRGDGDVVNLSDSMTATQAESQDMLGWFMEGANSLLLIKIAGEFETSMNAMDDIIGFNAHCYHECSEFFGRVFVEKKRLTAEQEKAFMERDLFRRSVRDPSNFLSRIYTYLQLE
jgi:hypothetical protein